MTKPMMRLFELVEKSANIEQLREIIGFAAEWRSTCSSRRCAARLSVFSCCTPLFARLFSLPLGLPSTQLTARRVAP